MLEQEVRQIGRDLFLATSEEPRPADLPERLVGTSSRPAERSELVGVFHRSQTPDDR